MKSALVLATVLMASGLMGCNGEKEVARWVSETESLKTTVIALSGVSDFTTEHQQAMRSYFARISELASLAREDSRASKAIAQYLLKSPAEICDRVFVTLETWTRIRGYCEQDGYFLCAEEVRLYPEILESLRAVLPDAVRLKFRSRADCVLGPDPEK